MKPLPLIPPPEMKIFFDWIARNLANANVLATVPTTEYLKQGDFVLYDDGTNYRLYANLNGTIRYISFDG